jgi:hypothetical protein
MNSILKLMTGNDRIILNIYLKIYLGVKKACAKFKKESVQKWGDNGYYDCKIQNGGYLVV